MPEIHPAWYLSAQGKIAILASASICLSLILRSCGFEYYQDYPLLLCYLLGGVPLLIDLIKKAWNRQFGSDLLAGISIITSVFLDQYLAGIFVVLMLSGGEALEAYALRRASSILDALAKRMPHITYRRKDGISEQISLDDVSLNDVLEVRPHDICPVDGIVLEGSSRMDESFLTGEPYHINKIPGSEVISGSINGEGLLIIKATALPIDSRYQKIAKIIESQASMQVPIRRLGDTLGAWYTPLALAIAIFAWIISGDPIRFLAVLVVATPCPLIIAIPIAVIGTISATAGRGIIVKNPAILEIISKCRTMILDKTGTLTYGKPMLTEVEVCPGASQDQALAVVASLENYSKHPLAGAIVEAASRKNLPMHKVDSISEKPGAGLSGLCDGSQYTITSRKKIAATLEIPPQSAGLECVVLKDNRFYALLRFRDTPREESRQFIKHLHSRHGIKKVKILSGDREQEVLHLAKIVGIDDVRGGLSPEQKIEDVKKELSIAPLIYVGDGINDAPALQLANVGIAIGTNSDITSEAADVVVLDPSLERVDELMHLSRRFRKIAMQSAVGGMALSIVGMGLAAWGLITPLAGAVFQEIIDIFAVLNALRTSFPPSNMHDDLSASADYSSNSGNNG